MQLFLAKVRRLLCVTVTVQFQWKPHPSRSLSIKCQCDLWNPAFLTRCMLHVDKFLLFPFTVNKQYVWKTIRMIFVTDYMRMETIKSSKTNVTFLIFGDSSSYLRALSGATPECLSLKWWIFGLFLTGGRDTYHWLSKCFRSERLLWIVSNVGGWCGAVGNVDYQWWWRPTPDCLSAEMSPHLKVVY